MSCPSCHLSTFYGPCMNIQVWKVYINLYETQSLFSKMICSVWLRETSHRDVRCLAQNSLTTNKSTVLVIHLHYISFLVLLVCLGKVNECSLSLHNHVALLQLSAVLFWCVSLFPVARPSNQLRSISDFLSSLISWGWPRGPQGSPS